MKRKVSAVLLAFCLMLCTMTPHIKTGGICCAL